MGKLEGKKAVITGAASGIGASTAKLLAAEGARVIVADVQAAGAEAVAEQIRQQGGTAQATVLDVASEASWQAALRFANDAYGAYGANGGIHILANIAGINSVSAVVAGLAEEQRWSTMLGINLTGAFLGTKLAAPYLRAAGGGAVVNIVSIASLKSTGGAVSPYALSKGALRSFTQGAARELAPDRIRVNAIHPGFVDTPLIATLLEGGRPRYEAAVPLGRLAVPNDIAQGVLYLASEAADYVTGAEITIDGGTTIGA